MTVAPHSGIIDFGVFTPPTASTDGIQGEVPPPLSIQAGYLLSAEGWISPSSINIPNLVGFSMLQGDPGEDAFVIPGPIGSTGPAGPAGPSGSNGIGIPGADGIDGEDTISIPGPQGPQGLQGPQGIAGVSGVGIPGADGSDGEDSPYIPGPQGPQGATGATGPAGLNGIGIPGADGDPGEDGAVIPGPIGATGATGATGPAGPAGIGIPGMDGLDGEDAPMIPGVAGAVDLATQVTGILAVPHGGTGLNTISANRLMLGNGTGAVQSLAAGTSTTVLHGNASGAPTWGAVALGSDVSGTLPYGNGGTGQTSFTANQSVFAGASALAGDSGFTRTAAGGRYLFGATDNGVDKVQINGGLMVDAVARLQSTGGQAILTSISDLYLTTSNTAGSVHITAAARGDIIITGNTPSSGDAGGITLQGADGSAGGSLAGPCNFAAGNGYSGAAGAAFPIIGGSCFSGNGDGGGVQLVPGDKSGTGTPGYLEVFRLGTSYAIATVANAASMDLPILVDGTLYRITLKTY